MAGKTDYNESEAVSEFIKKIEPSLAAVVESIRRIILSSGKEIGEQIKWNSPSFFYTGEMKPFNPKEYKRDIAVVNIHRGYTLLVFPTGERVKDDAGLLEGNYADGRRLIKFNDLQEVNAKEKALRKVITSWLQTVEK